MIRSKVLTEVAKSPGGLSVAFKGLTLGKGYFALPEPGEMGDIANLQPSGVPRSLIFGGVHNGTLEPGIQIGTTRNDMLRALNIRQLRYTGNPFVMSTHIDTTTDGHVLAERLRTPRDDVRRVAFRFPKAMLVGHPK